MYFPPCRGGINDRLFVIQNNQPCKSYPSAPIWSRLKPRSPQSQCLVPHDRSFDVFVFFFVLLWLPYLRRSRCIVSHCGVLMLHKESPSLCSHFLTSRAGFSTPSGVEGRQKDAFMCVWLCVCVCVCVRLHARVCVHLSQCV